MTKKTNLCWSYQIIHSFILLAYKYPEREVSKLFSKGPDSKYFRHCGPNGLLTTLNSVFVTERQTYTITHTHTPTHKCDCVSVKLYLQKQTTDWLLLMGHRLLILVLILHSQFMVFSAFFSCIMYINITYMGLHISVNIHSPNSSGLVCGVPMQQYF